MKSADSKLKKYGHKERQERSCIPLEFAKSGSCHLHSEAGNTPQIDDVEALLTML